MGRNTFVLFEEPDRGDGVHPANDAECSECGYVFGRVTDRDGRVRGVLSERVIQQAMEEMLKEHRSVF